MPSQFVPTIQKRRTNIWVEYRLVFLTGLVFLTNIVFFTPVICVRLSISDPSHTSAGRFLSLSQSQALLLDVEAAVPMEAVRDAVNDAARKQWISAVHLQHTPNKSHTISLSIYLSIYLSLSLSFFLSFFLSLSLSLSCTNTHKHTQTLTRSSTQAQAQAQASYPDSK
jgi:hypothetical protein